SRRRRASSSSRPTSPACTSTGRRQSSWAAKSAAGACYARWDGPHARRCPMRWPILKTLLLKEAMRHLANHGGVALILLLVAAPLLLSSTGGAGGPGPGGLVPGVRLCYVDYAEESPLVAHLRDHVPADLRRAVRFRPMREVPTDKAGTLLYASNTG